MNFFQRVTKRFIDFLLAGVISILCTPFVFILIIILSIETKAPGLYFSKRIGKNGKLFTMFKIRTMLPSKELQSCIVTANNPRVTRLGHFLRKKKLDELPQFWNVLIGNMSIVGPRPDLPGFADKLEGEDRIILSVLPGITGSASLAFRDEELLLAQQSNPEKYNREVIWPQKVQINKEYIKNYSLGLDIRIMWNTLF